MTATYLAQVVLWVGAETVVGLVLGLVLRPYLQRRRGEGEPWSG